MVASRNNPHRLKFISMRLLPTIVQVVVTMQLKIFLYFIHKSRDVVTTRKQAKGPGQRYQLLLQPVLMPRISTGCKSSWYLWPAANKGKRFGTGLKHHPVPKSQYGHRLVPSTGIKRTRRNRYRLVPVGGTNRCLKSVQWHRVLPSPGAATCPLQRHRLVTSTGA